MRILGIDPGINGGIALINNKTNVIDAIRTPVLNLRRGKKNKKFLDLYGISKTLEEFDPDHVFIESQQPYPKQGVISTFATGMGYGIYIGMIHIKGVPYTAVSPQAWKKILGVTSDKDEARRRASELMPSARDLWQLKCEDGVAEAAMLAYYGIQSNVAKEKTVH